MILPASAADINDDAVTADEVNADESLISDGESITESNKMDVELIANENYGIYGNTDTKLHVYAVDENGNNVTGGSVVFMDVFGKNYTADVSDGTAEKKVFVADTGKFNITCRYIGTDTYNDADGTLLLTVPVANTTCNNIVATRYGDTVYFTGNVVSDYTPFQEYGDFDDFEEVAEGIVTAYVDGEKLGSCDVDINGNYVYIWKTTRNLNGQTINFTGEFSNKHGHFNSSKFSKSFNFTAPSDTKIIYELSILENNTKLVCGNVLDENGNPVVGGTLTINNNNSVIVDSEGNFKFYISNETHEKAKYEIGVFDWGSKADIRINTPLMNAVEHSELTDELIDLCIQGTPYIKFGNGNGKTLVVNVGTHGGELPSQVAGFKLINLLADYGDEINGTIYVIPTLFPESTANNTRIYNGTNLNTIANVNGSVSNHVVMFATSINATGLGDFHNTRHSDSDVGITCAMCSHSPTPESYSIAKFIHDETGYYLDEYDEAGVPYAGAIEDYCNILGVPAVTCESLSNHRAVEYGTPEMSFNEMRAFLKYFGFDVDEMVKISLNDSDDIIATFTSPYNYNPSTVNISHDRTFSALQEKINNASEESTLSLEHDYEYDHGFSVEGLNINKTLTINGNGHTLDASGHGRIFSITGFDITLMNLNLINGFSKENGGAIISYGITLVNVTFENNRAHDGGAVYCSDMVTAENCIFNNNTARLGGNVYAYQGISISNSSFTNSKSKYAAAIYAQTNLEIENTVFENLTAEETAGAIGAKNFYSTAINNCTFKNTASIKNGGALFIDSSYRHLKDDPKGNDVSIEKCSFINSSADYGGALVHLDGPLNIKDCEFINNTAIYCGGAIYVSCVEFNITNTSIDGNKLTYGGNPSNGGGIYVDCSATTVENCIITDNEINGIYAYDGELTVKNSTISNNGEAIHGVFLDYTLEDIVLGNDTLYLNDTEYSSVVFGRGKELALINNSINVKTLPSRYDSRDWGWVSSVKDQGDMGACWTFGTCGALESTLLKVTGIEYDLSENNMQNSMLKYSKYGLADEFEGGVNEQGLEYILSWLGIFPAKYDSYDELGKLSPIISTNETIHIFDAIFVEPRKNLTDNDALKRAIIKCGSVETGICYDPTFYNDDTAAFYQTDDNKTSHAISLVGWDDNYPASNFLTAPPGNGAFIVKNSYGTDFGKEGFFYISYYDISLLSTTFAIGFLIENTDNYTANYQTDLGGKTVDIKNDDGGVISYQNSYGSFRPELISAVGTYFDANESYALEIYVNGELAHNQSGTAPFTGYHTVKLDKEIPIASGDIFTAVMTKESVRIFNDSRQHYLENVTFINYGDGLKDLSLENKTISLKVYTKDLSIYTDDLVKIYKNDSQFEAKIGVANESVIFEINGANYTRTSDENGTARMAINLNPGNYTIKTFYGGYAVENTITVLSTLYGNGLVKYYRNDTHFFVSLIDGAGNPVSGVNITMNINGVFYNRTTNENGTAKMNIWLFPNEYILTAIDPLTGLMMSYNITVISVLNASDMNMTYLDGSQFKAKVVDGQGNPLANAAVTFNINGIFYVRYTDSSGIAKLNIKLMPGEYIITSEYEGLKIANKITISAKED